MLAVIQPFALDLELLEDDLLHKMSKLEILTLTTQNNYSLTYW
jgi:hypothetical protein